MHCKIWRPLLKALKLALLLLTAPRPTGDGHHSLHHLVADDNSSATAETVYTDGGITYNPATNLLSLGAADVSTLKIAELLSPLLQLNRTCLTVLPAQLLNSTSWTALPQLLLRSTCWMALPLPRLNSILDGVTATAAELNILDGVTSTAAELNLLMGDLHHC